MVTTTQTTKFFYYSSKEHSICDTACFQPSDRTIDISLFDLANNEKLLDLLCLYYMVGNCGVTYTYESRAKWFAGYLSAFSTSSQDEKNEKLNTNPTVRLLILNEELFVKIKAIIK